MKLDTVGSGNHAQSCTAELCMYRKCIAPLLDVVMVAATPDTTVLGTGHCH